MKKLVIGAFAISTLPFSLIVKAEEGISVYCDNTFSEYQHSIKVALLLNSERRHACPIMLNS